MFGLLKESIIENLVEHYYQDKTTFQKKTKTILAETRNSKAFKEFQSAYNMIEETWIMDFDEARMFVNEVLDHLKSLDKKDLNSIAKNVKLNESYSSRKFELMDKLISEDVSGTDKIKYKTELVKLLTNKPQTVKSEPEHKFDPTYNAVFKRILNKKLSERISGLNEDEKKVLNVLIKEDANEIKRIYHTLISENINLIKNVNSDVKNLVENKLHEMEAQEVTTDALISLIELKKDLNNV